MRDRSRSGVGQNKRQPMFATKTRTQTTTLTSLGIQSFLPSSSPFLSPLPPPILTLPLSPTPSNPYPSSLPYPLQSSPFLSPVDTAQTPRTDRGSNGRSHQTSALALREAWGVHNMIFFKGEGKGNVCTRKKLNQICVCVHTNAYVCICYTLSYMHKHINTLWCSCWLLLCVLKPVVMKIEPAFCRNIGGVLLG